MELKSDPEAVASGAPDAIVDRGDVQLLGEMRSHPRGILFSNGFLARMGYKQELRRQYSTSQIFAVAFSIMGLVPSIASTLSFSLPAGPAGMVWVCDRLFSVSRFWLTSGA